MTDSRALDLKIRMAGARGASKDADRVAGSVRRIGKSAEYTNKRMKFAAATNKRLAASMSGVGRAAKLGAGLGIAAAGAEVFRATKGWEEHQKILRDVTATNASMGNVSGRSTKQINAQADSLEKASGIDADKILAGQKELLTFSNIRGKSFDSASDALAGMVDQGKDAKGSAIMVGKALNDPVKGVTALTKVGVSFSDQQRDQIKTLVKSGKSAEAQRMILRELKNEFPKTPPTGLEKLQILLRNLEDSLGKVVLPLVQKGAEWLTKFADEFAKGTGTGGKFRRILEAIGGALNTYLIQPIMAAVNWIRASHDRVTALAIGIGVITGIVIAFGIAAAVSWAMALAPVALVYAGIVLVAAGLYYAYQRVGWFRAAVDKAWSILKSVGEWLMGAGVDAFNFFKGVVKATGKVISNVFDFLTNLPNTIKGAFTSVLNWVIDRINDIIGFLNKAIDLANKLPGVNIDHIGPVGHIGGGDVVAANTAAYAGYTGTGTPISQQTAVTANVSPTVHTTINVDGKKVASAVQTAGNKKKSTR